MQDILPEFLDFFDSYAALIAPSAKYDGLRWPTTGIYSDWAYKLTTFDFETQSVSLRQWLIDRTNYLNGKIK